MLKERRNDLNLSQQYVSNQAGISLRLYQRLESGEHSLLKLSLQAAIAISDTLNLDIHTLVDRCEKDSQSKTEGRSATKMKKFNLYKTLGNIDKNIKKHELVEIVYGKDIDEATDDLIRAAKDEMRGMEQYAKGYTFDAYPPERVPSFVRTKKYAYTMSSIAYPHYGEKNGVEEYGITETETTSTY